MDLIDILHLRLTEEAGAVIRKLEDTKTGSKEEHDKEVIKDGQIFTTPF